MTQKLWSDVDDYLVKVLRIDDSMLERMQRAGDDAGLPPIQVSVTQGKLLELIVRMSGARRILEVGTLAGCSAAWMARGLPPDGAIVTIELDENHARVAAQNFEMAGLAAQVDLRIGNALEVLPQLVASGAGPFDLAFIDADKASNPRYFEYALAMSRKGSVIIVDNVIRDGAVIDEGSDDPSVVGVRELNELMADADVDVTAIQTVGAKGYDGFSIAIVR